MHWFAGDDLELYIKRIVDDDCKDLDLPGYDSYGNGSANPSLLIGADVADPISGSLPHRSYLCRVRPAEEQSPKKSVSQR